MDRLSTTTLSQEPPGVDVPGYDRATVTAGIAHFGAGNFHRAHQAVYCDALLNQGETEWGVSGISMRSPAMRDKPASQNAFYTVDTLGENASSRAIGASQRLLVAPEPPSL